MPNNGVKTKLNIFFNGDYKLSFIHMARLTSNSLSLGEQNHHKEKLNMCMQIYEEESSTLIQTNTETDKQGELGSKVYSSCRENNNLHRHGNVTYYEQQTPCKHLQTDIKARTNTQLSYHVGSLFEQK